MAVFDDEAKKLKAEYEKELADAIKEQNKDFEKRMWHLSQELKKSLLEQAKDQSSMEGVYMDLQKDWKSGKLLLLKDVADLKKQVAELTKDLAAVEKDIKPLADRVKKLEAKK